MLHPNKFLLKEMYGLEDVVAVEFQDACFMHGHL